MLPTRLRPVSLLALAAALSVLLPAAHARGERAGMLSSAEALALYEPAQQAAGFSGCRGLFPAARPIDLAAIPAQWKAVGLCSTSFAVVHSGATKTPLVVVERLSREHLDDAKGEARTNEFYADPRLPAGQRAELADYRGSGLDRGHMAPAADQPDARSMAQSFALSNMVPQARINNQRIWAKIEGDARKFARRAQGSVFVFSGPIFDAGHATVGANRVWVPTRLFKLVYDEASGRAWAWVLPNTDDATIERPMPYDAFVQMTGWRLLDAVPVKGSISP